MILTGCPGGLPLLRPPGSGVPSDTEVFDAIAAILRATRQFGDVLVLRDEEVDQAVARAGNRLLIVPSDPRAVRTRRQPTPGRRLRTVPYGIVVKLQAARNSDPYRELHRLSGIVHNALDGVEYTPYCLFEESIVEAEGYDNPAPPIFTAGLVGRFGYIVDDTVGMNGV